MEIFIQETSKDFGLYVYLTTMSHFKEAFDKVGHLNVYLILSFERTLQTFLNIHHMIPSDTVFDNDQHAFLWDLFKERVQKAVKVVKDDLSGPEFKVFVDDGTRNLILNAENF